MKTRAETSKLRYELFASTCDPHSTTSPIVGSDDDASGSACFNTVKFDVWSTHSSGGCGVQMWMFVPMRGSPTHCPGFFIDIWFALQTRASSKTTSPKVWYTHASVTPYVEHRRGYSLSHSPPRWVLRCLRAQFLIIVFGIGSPPSATICNDGTLLGGVPSTVAQRVGVHNTCEISSCLSNLVRPRYLSSPSFLHRWSACSSSSSISSRL